MKRFLYYFRVLLLALLSACIASCGMLKKEEKFTVLTMESSAIEPSASEVSVYFIKRSWRMSERPSEQLSFLLKHTGIKEFSDYEVLSYHRYNLISGQPLRDNLQLADNAKQILVVIRNTEGTKLLSRAVNIKAKKVKVITVKVLGNLIKITVE